MARSIAALCYLGVVPRTPSPAVRRALIEQAAALLARREPVALRSLAAATGVSTMAVYTYFGGMPGLWSAVRQEGFDRLGDRLANVRPARDPVRHLAALGVAYVEHAVGNPDLYRVMFDAAFDLPDPECASASFELIIHGAEAAQRAGRFSTEVEPGDAALRFWASGHGLTSLAVAGVLPLRDLLQHAPTMAVAIFTDAGDVREEAERSVAAAWRNSALDVPRPAS